MFSETYTLKAGLVFYSKIANNCIGMLPFTISNLKPRVENEYFYLHAGGSYSNMLGMNLARFHKFPEVKTNGLHGLPRLVAFVSADSHYSLKKNGSLIGLGSNNIVAIECDDKGKMKLDDLELQINETIKQVGNALKLLTILDII